MQERRKALGGTFHRRKTRAQALQIPPLSAFQALLKASGEGRESSTTMAFVRILNILVKDKQIGKHIVPIVADESRTFGMEGMFRQLGIWSSSGSIVYAAGCRSANVLQGRQARADSAGRNLKQAPCHPG
jgi:pyruvate dehydrogenase E1 component